jgi:hypothetical protein
MSSALPSPGYQSTMPEGGGVQVRHLPAEPALTMAEISEAVSARLKISTSSIRPVNR